MSIYPSFKYQLLTQKMAVIIYYAVLLGLILLFGGAVLISYGNGDGENSASSTITTGLSGITAVMVFVLGLNSFKENFGMALQNGVSRKSLFLARLCASGALCLVLSVCDELFTLLCGLVGKLPWMRCESCSLYQLAYGGTGNAFLDVLCSVAFSFFLLLAVSALGYFITALFYRLPVWGKVAVGVSFGAVFSILEPVLKMLRDFFHLEALWAALESAAEWFWQIAFSAAPNCMVFCFAVFCLFNVFAWLLIRRAALK